MDEGSLVELLGSVDEGASDSLAQLATICYVLVGVGTVLMVIGFLGCCGAIRESRCMLMTVSMAGCHMILGEQPICQGSK